MKKFLKIFLGIIAFFLVLILVLPIFFEGTIVEQIRKLVNKNINAKFDFENADLSFLSSFPNIGLDMDKVALVNNAPFEGDTLFYADNLHLSLPVGTLFGGDAITVNTISVDKASVNVLVNGEGKTNYDIALDTDTAAVESESSDSNFKLDLKSYSIKDSRIRYKDDSSGIELLLEAFNHKGEGDLSLQQSTLRTESNTLVSVIMDSTVYLNRNSISLDADLGIDLATQKYIFQENTATINQLPLIFDGYVQMLEEGQDVQLTFSTPDSDFRNFLALIPEKYSGNIEGVKTTGELSVKGEVKGKVTEKTIPHFEVLLASEQASFKYPDLPKTVEDITFRTRIYNDSGITEDTRVDLDTLHFKIAGDEFGARASVAELMGNTKVDALLKGALNLKNVSDAVPAEMVSGLEGRINMDVRTAFDSKAIEEGRYADTKTSGSMQFNGVSFSSAMMPEPVNLEQGNVVFDQRELRVNDLSLKTGKTDLEGNGVFQDYLQAFLSDQQLKGEFNLSSNEVYLADLMTSEESVTDSTVAETGDNSFKIPAFLDLNLNGKVGKLHYDNIVLQQVNTSLKVADETVKLEKFEANVFNGKINLEGNVSTKADTPDFDLGLNISSFDIAQSFASMDLLNALAPVFGSIKGDLNSTIRLSGQLSEALTPILSGISGKADAEVNAKGIEGGQSNLLSTFDSKVAFVDLNQWLNRTIKTNFSFENGRVKIAPFTVKNKDVSVTIAGDHGFDGSLHYNAVFDVPASYLGNDVQKLLSNLGDSGKDITVPVTAVIGGTMKSPQISTDMESTVTKLSQELVSQQKDQLVSKGKEEVNKALNDLIKSGSKDSDTTKTETTEKSSVEKVAKDVLGNLFKKKKDTVN
ncbi:AsmA family protein [Robertkochia solimangrovi]|uniref:AsmA family protein n=1 Tax=Robertkochia solimangrovi TaxID=2213046 RepID=UPI00117D38DA|nr:AsmA family protein [Robertkochia solimangrovi]TRZ44443.1 AsmA family protein [Robertkochia solimangrovi]